MGKILIQYGLLSILLSVFVMYLYDHTIGRVVNHVTAATIRVGVFASVWTILTIFLGARSFTKMVTALRHRTKSLGYKVVPIPKDVH